MSITALLITGILFTSTLACAPSESTDEVSNETNTSTESTVVDQDVASSSQPVDVPAMIERCLGTWTVSADSGKFDREGYFFVIQQEADSLVILAYTGEIRDNRISYAIADLSTTSSGWTGVTKDEYYINETTWVFSSETTATMIVDGRFTETNEFLGRKSIFLTKKE